MDLGTWPGHDLPGVLVRMDKDHEKGSEMTKPTETKPKPTRARKASTKTRELRTVKRFTRDGATLSLSLCGRRIHSFRDVGDLRERAHAEYDTPEMARDAFDAKAAAALANRWEDVRPTRKIEDLIA